MLHNIEQKIVFIEEECHSRFLSDKIYQGSLLHYLYLVSDSSVTLAEMIIKYHSNLLL